MLRQDDYQKTKLVDVGYTYGLPYGGHLAACMIMGCIATRVRKGWGSWLDVINNIPRYSATMEQPPIVIPQIWEPSFIRLLHEVEGIYDGTSDPSKGAVYWADTRSIETEFFKNKILANQDDHKRVLEMNTLVCYT